jgi:hypothetical protein
MMITGLSSDRGVRYAATKGTAVRSPVPCLFPGAEISCWGLMAQSETMEHAKQVYRLGTKLIQADYRNAVDFLLMHCRTCA